MAQSKAGPRSRPSDLFPPLPADHPLFKRGYIFGIRRAAFSSSTEPAPAPLDDPPAQDDLGDWMEALDGFLVEGIRKKGRKRSRPS